MYEIRELITKDYMINIKVLENLIGKCDSVWISFDCFLFVSIYLRLGNESMENKLRFLCDGAR